MRWLIFCFLIAPAWGQVAAELSGTVSDQSGGTVGGARVAAENVETGAVRQTITAADGRYQFAALPVGQYALRASRPGFSETVMQGVNLAAGQSAAADLTLRVGESSQQVTVTGDAKLADVNAAHVSGLVGEQQVKDLPLNGRSYDELLTLNPGVVNFTWEKTGGIGVSNSTAGNNFAVAGQPAAAESVPAERHRIHRRGGKQHAARRHQPATAGRGRGARIQPARAIPTAPNTASGPARRC